VTRRVGVLLIAGLLLCACGTVSEAKAMSGWVAHSSFNANAKSLFSDVKGSAKDLRNAHLTSNDFHTVCQVLFSDDGAMQAALPTPDAQATSLLNKAYQDFAKAAHQCYDAQSSAVARSRALATLASGAAVFSEAKARVATASQS
jgi:hypothetical protein